MIHIAKDNKAQQNQFQNSKWKKISRQILWIWIQIITKNFGEYDISDKHISKVYLRGTLIFSNICNFGEERFCICCINRVCDFGFSIYSNFKLFLFFSSISTFRYWWNHAFKVLLFVWYVRLIELQEIYLDIIITSGFDIYRPLNQIMTRIWS